jgi:hypothetical protein
VKYIAAAMEHLNTKHSVAERDLSLLERILAGDPDPSTACILALDLILVGIDTVSSRTASILVGLDTVSSRPASILVVLDTVSSRTASILVGLDTASSRTASILVGNQ